MLKTVKQQDKELMAGLRSSFRKRKEEEQARPPQPTIMVKDPRTGEAMSKADYEAKYYQK